MRLHPLHRLQPHWSQWLQQVGLQLQTLGYLDPRPYYSPKGPN